MDLNKLWNQVIGKEVDDATLLVQEQKRVAELKEATRIAKERQEVRNQLIDVQKERKELEAGLGQGGSKLVLYIAGLGGLLVIALIMKSCMGC